jgi:hypothetical protein
MRRLSWCGQYRLARGFRTPITLRGGGAGRPAGPQGLRSSFVDFLPELPYIWPIPAGSVLSAQGPPRGDPKRPLLIVQSMRTIVYVDGFNLYYWLLEKRPGLKWLNVKQLATKLLSQKNQIVRVRY